MMYEPYICRSYDVLHSLQQSPSCDYVVPIHGHPTMEQHFVLWHVYSWKASCLILLIFIVSFCSCYFIIKWLKVFHTFLHNFYSLLFPVYVFILLQLHFWVILKDSQSCCIPSWEYCPLTTLYRQSLIVGQEASGFHPLFKGDINSKCHTSLSLVQIYWCDFIFI